MSQLRLSRILSQLLRKRCVGIGRCIRKYSINPWNPPEIVRDIQGESITIRAMRQNDVPEVINLIRSRDMADFSESDIPCAMQCSNFYGAVAENPAGEMIGCMSTMNYACKIVAAGRAFLGPTYRGRGIPTFFFYYFKRFALPERFEYTGYVSEDKKSFAAQLDARLDTGSGSFLRMVGHFSETFLQTKKDEDVVIRELNRGGLDALLQYDQSVHVLDRSNHMCEIIDHPSSRTFVAFRDNVICGYGILTKCFLSYRIAPLFADNPHVARELYRNMGQEAPPDNPVSMVVSSRNAAAMDIIAENTFDIAKKVYRIKVNTEPSVCDININYNKVFSLTGLSFSVC